MRYGHVTGRKQERRLPYSATPEQRAHDIAMSMCENNRRPGIETWHHYGIADNETMQKLVLSSFEALDPLRRKRNAI